MPDTEPHHDNPFDTDLQVLHSKDFFARMKSTVKPVTPMITPWSVSTVWRPKEWAPRGLPGRFRWPSSGSVWHTRFLVWQLSFLSCLVRLERCFPVHWAGSSSPSSP